MSVSIRFEGVVRVREWPEGRGMVTYWCPGCSAGHTIVYGTAEAWTWDGNCEAPTFNPSVLCLPHPRSFDPANPDSDEPAPPQPRCHSFVRNGRIEYLSDCGHPLAGQTIDMVPLPDRYAAFISG